MTANISSASCLANSFENMIINHVLRSGSHTGSLCALLLYEKTDEEDTSTEISGGGYVRNNVLNRFELNTSNNSACALLGGGTGDMSATTNWGDVHQFGLKNSTTTLGNSGSLLIYGSFSSSRTIRAGEKASVENDTLEIHLYGNITPYLSYEILDHYLNNNHYRISASNVSIGLYYQTSSGSVEVSGSVGYSRITHSGNSGCWTTPTTGSTSNTGSIIFTYEAPLDWGVMAGVAIFDSASAGSAVFLIPIGTDVEPITVLTGDGLKINQGDLKIYLN